MPYMNRPKGRVERRPKSRGSRASHRLQPLASDVQRFRLDVRLIEGAEGDWLKGEIGMVVRDLLLWALQDRSACEGVGTAVGEGRPL